VLKPRGAQEEEEPPVPRRGPSTLSAVLKPRGAQEEEEPPAPRHSPGARECLRGPRRGLCPRGRAGGCAGGKPTRGRLSPWQRGAAGAWVNAERSSL